MGITPAWAGKSVLSAGSRPCSRDHPRVGGEKARTLIVQDEPQGSPPRERGKEARQCQVPVWLRITPAQAGKRTRSWRAYGCPWDHPRVGGEKGGAWWIIILFLGSPPRGRGKGRRVVDHHPLPRITPAWAGKSICLALPITAPRDHPRMGGEKARDRASVVMVKGSPPRGRGKARHLSHSLLPCG